jgi:hypothetical protein
LWNHREQPGEVLETHRKADQAQVDDLTRHMSTEHEPVEMPDYATTRSSVELHNRWHRERAIRT